MKKGDVSFGMVVIIILMLISAVFAFQLLKQQMDTIGKFSSQGALCLATLKLQEGSSQKITEDISIGLLSQKCSTIYEQIKLIRTNVPSPINESNKKWALEKKIADRMALVWWMIGAGELKTIWQDNGIIQDYLKSIRYDPPNWQCLTMMEFTIEESSYLPEKPLYSGDLLEFLRNTEYVVNKGGTKTVMTYYEYLTSFAGIDTGKVILGNVLFKPGETYAISILNPPTSDKYSFLGVMGYCMGGVVVGYASGKLGATGVTSLSTGSILLGSKQLASSVAIGSTFDYMGEQCGNSMASLIEGEELTDALKQSIEGSGLSEALYKDIDQSILDEQPTHMFVSTSKHAGWLGCVKISAGEKQ